METDFLADVGGEANVRPKEGDTVARNDGTMLRWTRFRSQRDRVNLEEHFGIQPWSVAYAYCELNSDEAVETGLRTISYWSQSLWLNGAKVRGIPVHADNPGTTLLPAFPVRLNAGRNACLLKLGRGWNPWHFAFQPLPPSRATATIHVTDPAGLSVAQALVEFYDQPEFAGRLTSDDSGNAEACLFPSVGVYDLHVTSDGLDAWVFDAELPPGEHREYDVVLSNAVSISGKVLAMDGSPQNAIVVQAVRVMESPNPVGTDSTPSHLSPRGVEAPKHSRMRVERVGTEEGTIKSLLPMPPFSATAHTDTNGAYRFINLLPGKYRLRCHGLHGYFFPGGGQDPDASEPLVVEAGQSHGGIDFVIPEIKKGVWKAVPFANTAPWTHKSIFRTADGMLWIGTLDFPLQAYDGVEFKTFSVPDKPEDTVHAIDQTPDGAIWVGSGKGICRIVDGQISSFPSEEQLPRKELLDIQVAANGSIWFATQSGACRYDGRVFETFDVGHGLPDNVVNSILETRDGALWVGTMTGLARFDGRRFSEPEWVLQFGDRGAANLHEARDGAIWFGCPDWGFYPGAYRLDGKTLWKMGKEEGLLDEPVLAIAETSDGVLWLGTETTLSRFNGTTVVNYTREDGISGVANVHIADIFVDADDVLWCAGTGLSRFDPSGLTGFTRRDGISGLREGGTAGVMEIERESEKHFWIGTGHSGAFRTDGMKLEAPVLEKHMVTKIHRAAGGALWFGTHSGIDRFENGQMVRVLERNNVNALATDVQGDLWYGDGWVGGGLSRFNPAIREETTFTTTDGLPNNHVWAIEPASDGGVWVGTEKGLARYRNGQIEDFREKLGIMTGAVWEIRREPDETLWISSALGLHILEPNHGEADLPVRSDSPQNKQGGTLTPGGREAPTSLRSPREGGGAASLAGFQRISITAANGLPDEDIRCGAQTRDGIIWMGSNNRGLLGFDGKAVTAIDSRDGPIGNQGRALMVDQDGSLWIGTNDGGLAHYRRGKTRPSVRLMEVQLDDQTLTDFSDLPSPEIKSRVAVQYQEIDLKTHSDKRQFWYEVKDPSGDTLYAGVTKDRRFEWTPRKGGSYTFEVQAIDRDLNYSEPTRLSFIATVPWHANAWITVSGGGAFAGLLVWAFIARAIYLAKRREAERLHERARIARDLHDHLGAGLTHVALLGDFVRKNTGQPGPTQAALATQLIESAHDLSRTMAEVIWATDPSKDTLRSFVSFVSDHAEKFFGASALRLRLDFPDKLPAVQLPAEARHNLFLVAKETLNNVAKHAHASEVRIKLDVSDGELCLSIEDDGRGFLKSKVGKECHGLANMAKRLCDLDGQLEIVSEVGRGTQVRARMPLPKQ